MLCAQCHQNEASVFFKKIANNQITQLALCRECAQSRGLLSESHDPLIDLLAGLEVILKKQTSAGRPGNQRCASCGITYAQFMKTGRLGCPDCYSAFRKPLTDLLPRIHGSLRHVGRNPAAKPRPAAENAEGPAETADILRLREQLKEAVDREAFEEAARLRDRIRRLEADS